MKMSRKMQGHCLWRSMSSSLFHFKTPKRIKMHREFFPYFPPKYTSTNPMTIMSTSSMMNTSLKSRPTEMCPSITTLKPYLKPNETFSQGKRAANEAKAKSLKDYKYDFHSKIFHDKNKIFKQQKRLIDNKLNIRYAENEAVYQKQLKILNKKKLKEGKTPIKDATPNLLLVNKQIGDIKESISFIKCVTNYAYIDIESEKIRWQTNQKQLFKSQSAPFYVKVDDELKRRESDKSHFLRKPLVIQAYKVK